MRAETLRLMRVKWLNAHGKQSELNASGDTKTYEEVA